MPIGDSCSSGTQEQLQLIKNMRFLQFSRNRRGLWCRAYRQVAKGLTVDANWKSACVSAGADD